MIAFKNLLKELLDGKVRFLVVGGYAAIAHGLTRTTEDLDIWIEPTLENASKTRQALKKFGITVDDLSIETIADPYCFLRLGEETGYRIDIMAIPGGERLFNQSWGERFETEYFDLTVPFLGLKDLILIKKAIGRHKDLADVEGLLNFHQLKEEDTE